MKNQVIKNEKRFVEDTIKLLVPEEIRGQTEYMNGGGYIQLTVATHARFILNYRMLVEQNVPELLTMFDACPNGFIGRHLDDGNQSAYALWNYASRIDNQLRLWGQPYFATHQNEAKQICLATM